MRSDENIQKTLPPVFAIWAETASDRPLAGQSGFLAEKGKWLFYTAQEEAEQKVDDMTRRCMNREPVAAYHCVAYPNDSLPDTSLSVECINQYDLTPDFGPKDYVVKDRIYGNTGGGCMVATVSCYLPSLDKTVWVNCGEEDLCVSASDCTWNEDQSGSWSREEDVRIFSAALTDAPEKMGVWLPMALEAVVYMSERSMADMGRIFEPSEAWRQLVNQRKEQQLSGEPSMTMSC